MLIKKRIGVVVCLLTLAVGAFAQQTTTIDISKIDLSQLNPSQADLTGAKFYFEGPAEFYVTGVRYGGMVWSAILDYDGKGTFTIKDPAQGETATGKPMSIDLSGISLKLASNGIQLNNIGINGATYSGTLALNQNKDLVIAGQPMMTGAQSSQVASLQSLVGSLQSQVASLQNDLTARDRTIADLKKQAPPTSAPATAAPMAAAAPSPADYPNTIVSGFAGGTGKLGTWVVSGNSLQQQNADSLYAKYVAAVPQRNLQYFYQFAGHATGSGWRGYGVHILADGSQTANGYGYGTSYLVWVTRDPSSLQTDKTFVQLYKSYDDVHMVQLASQEIPGGITSDNTIGVAVNRASNTITVLANGKVVFSYQSPDNVASGSGIALRALGTVTFTQAQIKTK